MIAKDFTRRRTQPDRPFIHTGDALARKIHQSQNPCGYECFDCLTRGPVTFIGQPAALRFLLTFYSTHEIYSQFNGEHIVTFNGSLERWESEPIEIECDAVAGEFIFAVQRVDLPYTLEPGGVQLSLHRVDGLGCPDFLQVNWFNVQRFEGLCSNAFRLGSASSWATKAPLAVYDTSQACEICLEPVGRGLQTVTLCDFAFTCAAAYMTEHEALSASACAFCDKSYRLHFPENGGTQPIGTDESIDVDELYCDWSNSVGVGSVQLQVSGITLALGQYQAYNKGCNGTFMAAELNLFCDSTANPDLFRLAGELHFITGGGFNSGFYLGDWVEADEMQVLLDADIVLDYDSESHASPRPCDIDDPGFPATLTFRRFNDTDIIEVNRP